MSAYRAVLLALFVVGAAMVAAVPAGATTLHSDDGDAASVIGDSSATRATDERVGSRSTAVENETQNNSSLGADISSFMQSSAAEVGGAVELGMWTAAYNGTENRTVRTQLVERQTSDLRDQLADLRERKAELVAERNATNVSDAAYKAKIAQLLSRIDALKMAINATAVRAKEVDTNVDAVTALRTEADNLTGPEIAAVARNVTGVGSATGVGNGTRGGPIDIGNATPGNSTGVGNGTRGGPTDLGNATPGNSAGVGDGAAANRSAGPASDVANGTTTGAPNSTTTDVASETTTSVTNETTVGSSNRTTSESQRGPSSRANASMVGEVFGPEVAKATNGVTSGAARNGTAATGTNAGAANGAGNATDDAPQALTIAATASSDVVDSVSDALAVDVETLASALSFP